MIQPSTQSGQENKGTVLICTYEISSQYAWLHWYRQYPNGVLEFIMQGSSFSSSFHKELKDDRFTQTANSTTTILNIFSLELRDAAMYYCALEDNHSNIMQCTVVQKLRLERC